MRGLLLHLRNNPEDDDCTYHSADEFSEPACNANAQEAEEPAAEGTAENTDDEVHHQAQSAALHQFAGAESGQTAHHA